MLSCSSAQGPELGAVRALKPATTHFSSECIFFSHWQTVFLLRSHRMCQTQPPWGLHLSTLLKTSWNFHSSRVLKRNITVSMISGVPGGHKTSRKKIPPLQLWFTIFCVNVNFFFSRLAEWGVTFSIRNSYSLSSFSGAALCPSQTRLHDFKKGGGIADCGGKRKSWGGREEKKVVDQQVHC